ncbi:hypothetical protein AS850_04720 [Frondihabitans sp. 762G35]|uniref:peptidoglycan-binding domain-containing protein n=1 Tax=Frondihabitans sp. 762G35 TaxID=1446794 RepID=UPI000D214975|nr:peptidoglycan-binding protein [Frondihabitans sp. 762G35]ARC56378.1 hypothetical protein AS850_04720 [Frondihabitans sp. 762G35]
MIRLRELATPSVGLIAVLACGALGAAIALATTSQPTPSSLESIPVSGSVPTSTRTFDDARSVEVVVERGPDRHVTSRKGGWVTASGCAPGAVLTSGTRIASVDGMPLLGLATSEPLWRDLAAGDSGDDVRSLQSELSRLGYPVRADGVVGPETIQAFAAVWQTIEPRGLIRTTVASESIAWLPTSTVTASTCDAPIGARVEPGDALATLPPAATRATLGAMPDDLAAGERQLVVGDLRIDVDEGGVVSDESSLAELATIADGSLGTEGVPPATIAARLVLTHPARVVVVPPSSLYGVEGTRACVSSEGGAIRVTIVASELGQTLVIPDGDTPLPGVSLDESARRPCA